MLRTKQNFPYAVFSGASGHKNKPQSTHLKGKGPLPKGQYYVVDRPTGGKQDWIRKNIADYDGKTKWFGLFRKDGHIGDETVIKGVRRGQFRMHPGGRSAGCVTFVHEKDFKEVRKMLLSTSKKKIPAEQPAHDQSLESLSPSSARNGIVLILD